jgi:antitoxin Phd
MMVNTNAMLPMTEANQNFSKVTRVVDETGLAVILKNNKPRYVIVNFDEYEEIQELRKKREQKVLSTADKIISKNMEAFKELAK